MKAFACNFVGALQGLFVYRKLNGLADWSWWWVWSPLWISLLLITLFFIALIVAFTRTGGIE